MKKTFILILLLIFIFPGISKNAPDKEKKVTTYYLLRHAEKITADHNNPELTNEGKERAKKWKEILRDIDFDEIYSTDFIRTIETVRPLAESQGISIKIYDYENFDFNLFKRNTENKTILISGHSNTTPDLVNLLIGENRFPEIHHDNNGNLYIVDIVDETVSVKLIHIN